MVATEEPAAQHPAAPGLFTVVGVVVLGVLAAAFSGGWQINQRFIPWPGSDQATPRDPPLLPPVGPDKPPPPAYLGVWVSALFGLMAAVFVGALAWWLWVRFAGIRRRRRRAAEVVSAAPPGSVAHTPDLPTLLRGIEEAEALLDQPGDPKDAIIRSWLAMEDAAARSGAVRRPADTPTEFTTTVLARTQADPGAVDGLLHLYHLARFSRHEIGTAEIVQARQCVRTLANSWTRFDSALRATVP